MDSRVLLVLLALRLGASDALAGQQAAALCHEDMGTALSLLDDAMPQLVEAGNPMRAETAVRDAARLFRVDRRQDALRKLDATLELLNGAWGRPIDAGRRSAVVAAIREARRCVETQGPPPLATLLVRTFLLDPDAPRGVGAPAGAGVLVGVGEENTRVGQTGADGTVIVRVPPGGIPVSAQKPLAAGEAYVTLAPGGSGELSVVLDPDSHDLQLTDLVLVEAPNDVIEPTAPSFTFKFMENGVFLPVTVLDDVRIVGRFQESLAFLDELFAVVDGTITATDPAKVQAALAAFAGQRIGIQVEADDAARFQRWNIVWLRVASK